MVIAHGVHPCIRDGRHVGDGGIGMHRVGDAGMAILCRLQTVQSMMMLLCEQANTILALANIYVQWPLRARDACANAPFARRRFLLRLLLMARFLGLAPMAMADRGRGDLRPLP